jgi:hypothetical protein
MLDAALFLLCGAILVAGVWLLAGRVWPDDRLARWTTLLLLVPAIVVGVTLVVGAALRSYSALPLAVSYVVCGVLAALLARRISPVARPRPLELRATGRLERLASNAVVVLAAVALAWRALIALVLPQNAYDALAYHLPTIGEWVRTGRVYPTALTRDLCCAWYPSSGEAWGAWSAPFLHSDRLVGLGQVWTAALLGLAVTLLARSWGSPTWLARVGGALAVLMPVVIAQADTAYVDVTYAAALVAAFAFVAIVAHTERAAMLAPSLLCGIAIGLAIGVKGTGLAGGTLCAVALVVVLVWRHRRAALRPILLAAILALALALPWYLVAWHATGNPLEPYQLQVAGTTIFDGTVSYRHLTPPDPQVARVPAVLRPLRSWVEDLHVLRGGFRYAPDVRSGGFGPLFLLVALPALLWLLLARGVRRRDVSVLAVLLVVAVALVLQPYAWWTRFTIPLGAVGMAAIAVALAALGRRTRTLLLVVLLLGAAIPLLKVGVGNSDVVAHYGRTQVFTSAASWLVHPPSTAEAMPARFGPLDQLGDGPILVDAAANNRVPALALGRQFDRRVVLERIDPATVAARADQLGATDVVLSPARFAALPAATRSQLGAAQGARDVVVLHRR